MSARVAAPRQRLSVVPFVTGDEARWDEFVAGAPMATMMHTRRFLSYHGDRFSDLSLLLEDERGRLAGVFPAAVDPNDDTRVTSHPGLTYGGVVHCGALLGERMIDAIELIADHYASLGFRALRYKVVPHIYHRVPSQDDHYALFRVGATRYRSDLSCSIDVDYAPEPSTRRKRGRRKAAAHGITIDEGPQYVEELWAAVRENLERKYGLVPVHSEDEIALLNRLFPENVRFVVALYEGHVIAGATLFNAPSCFHVQYSASNARGYELSAMDLVLAYCVEQAREAGARFLDLGISTEEEGRKLNLGLYEFKVEFGGAGVTYETYELALDEGRE